VGRGIRLTPKGSCWRGEWTPRVSSWPPVWTSCRRGVGGRIPNGPQHPVPKAATELSRTHPGIGSYLVDAQPADRLKMRRSGRVDIALIFRLTDPPLEEEGMRLTHLLDDPLCLVSDESISVSMTTVTPAWGLAAANAVEPPRSRHVRAQASHHASPTPATTRSSPSRWWPPAWGRHAQRARVASALVPGGPPHNTTHDNARQIDAATPTGQASTLAYLPRPRRSRSWHHCLTPRAGDRAGTTYESIQSEEDRR
jgi:hypothetical protein